MKIDIIIPIYNAYDYLVECVNSVYRYTNIDDFNLFLIDDCSTDERIGEYLSKIQGKFSNLIVMSNNTNLGFVGTANKGMMQSENDVILLNSDTEVTKNWLFKIHKAAYFDESVATVTTLTNSGTICSVPNFCEDNGLPNSYKFLDEYANDIEKHTIELYQEAPTGVGFCMFIKRSVLDIVGYFDEEKFGKGYGEENDFCCRCLEYGFRNIIDDATFIYHKGSASFSGKKAEYSATNSKVLEELYPYYFPSVAKFIESNPLEPVHKMVKLQIDLKRFDRNVLFLLHNDFIEGRNHPYGGTELHVQDLINGMKKNTNSFVLTPHKNSMYLDVFSDGYKTTLRFDMKAKIMINENHNFEYTEIINAILNYFEIQIIHIHHLKGHSLDIFQVAKKLNIPLFYTVHDYFCLCPRINLLYDGETYCRYIRSNETCNKCIQKQFGYQYLAQAWRSHYIQNLLECDMIFYPDESVFENIKSYCNDFNLSFIPKNHKCIPHGMDFGICENKNYSPNKIMRICIFGGVSKHKGSHYLEKLIQDETEFEWHILGNIYDFIVDECANVKFYGAYDRKDIINILSEIKPDIILNLSICPETYSYVLSEALVANIPVIATSIGAFENRIINDVNGWKIAYPIDIDEIKNLLNKLSLNPTMLMDVRNQPKQYFHLDTMIEQYVGVYETYSPDMKHIHSVEQNRLINEALMNYNKGNFIEDHNNSNQAEYEQLLKHVQEINDSTTWKICNYVVRILNKIKHIFKH